MKVVVDIPDGAVGLFVGKKFRNVKELQQSDGIRFLRVDFNESRVEVVGTNAGIEKVRRRVDMAANIAANASCYFPQTTMTVFDHDAKASVRFERVSLPGLAAQFDPDRTYHRLVSSSSSENDDDDGLEDCRISAEDSGVEHPYVGFDSREVDQFFGRVVRDALDVLASGRVLPLLYVKFGKTLLSSVPTAALESGAFRAAELRKLPLGSSKNAARPEFNGLFRASTKEKLVELIAKNDYEHVSTRREVRISCERDDETKKKYNITYVEKPPRDDDDDDDEKDLSSAELAASAALRQVARAKTYFDVLGVGAEATDRDVRIAFRKLALQVHPEKNKHPAAEDAFQVLSAAFEELQTEEKRDQYRLGSSITKLRVQSRQTTSIIKCTSPERKVAFFSVLRPGTRAEFRTTLETETSFGKTPDRETLLAVEDARKNKRADNHRLVFRDGTAFKINVLKNITSNKHTNGTFELSIEDSREEWFGKTVAGVAIYLESYAVNDLLDEIKGGRRDDAVVRELLSHIQNLNAEARHIIDLFNARG
ncbi:hypothetical protein CTAYLR_009999 [Chrysophaeum taylorii]|uniref:J domain-containing protein n=1 Tax=Chrysophaeum taylorii TaxID=2483200 RepID=A0AAD7U9Q6_9STRA|nr:hypothetical protein CTAYLR_009999 [Chrysophaeum taylorii]